MIFQSINELIRDEDGNSIGLSQVDFTNSINGSDIRISRVIVPQKLRGNGLGKSLMEKTCKFLDRERLSCELEPKPYNNTWSKEKLIYWYSQFGFMVYANERNIFMIRQPKLTS